MSEFLIYVVNVVMGIIVVWMLTGFGLGFLMFSAAVIRSFMERE